MKLEKLELLGDQVYVLFEWFYHGISSMESKTRFYLHAKYNDSNMLTYTCIAEKNSLESSHHRISYTVSNARATYMYHGGEKD